MWKQRYFAGFSNMFRDLGPAGIGGHLPISAHKWLFFAIFDKLHDWDATFLRFWARNIVFFGVSAILHVWLYLYGAKNDKLSRFWSVSIILVCFDLEILKCLMPHTPLPCITVSSDCRLWKLTCCKRSQILQRKHRGFSNNNYWFENTRRVNSSIRCYQSSGVTYGGRHYFVFI